MAARIAVLGILATLGCGGGELKKIADAAADAAVAHDLAPDLAADAPAAPDLGMVVVSPSRRLRIVRPASGVFLSTKIDLEVTVEGPPPIRVLCLTPANVVVAALEPPFRHAVNTRGVPDGPLTFSCLFHEGREQHVSAPVTITLDQTPPSIVRRTPLDGSDAAPGDPIRAVFSEPIAESAADAVEVRIDGAPATRTVEWSADRTGLTITLANRPKVPSEVQVMLGGLTDGAGNPLGVSGGCSWRYSSVVHLGGPLARTLGLTFGYSVNLTLDAGGKPWVSWTGGDENDSKVQVQSWNAGQARWESLPSLRVAAASAAFPSRSSLALDPAGRPVVFWEEVPKPYGTFKIHGRRWNGTAWDPLEGLPDLTNPSVVVDGAGNITVLLSPYSGGGAYRAFRWHGDRWQQLGGEVGQLGSTIAFLAGNATGDLEATWSRQVGGTQFIPERRRLVGDTWTAPAGTLPYDPQSTGAMSLRALIGPDGVSRYVWTELVLRAGQITQTPALYQSGWANRQVLPDLAAEIVSGPMLTLDASSAPVLATGQRSSRALHVRRWTGSAWQVIGAPIIPSPTNQDGAPTPGGLAFTPSGQLVIAMSAIVGKTPEVFVYRVDP